MAQRRMFSLKVVDTDAFMDMPLSAQALYFHLGMRADDDGFVSNARRVQKLVGAADDDLKILLMKRFVLTFDSGVIVIKHWRLNNYVKGDRYTPTLYQEEKGTLYVKGNGVYTDHPLPPPKVAEPNRLPPASPAEMPGQATDTECLQNGSILETQVRVGQGSVGEVSLGQGRLEKVNNLSGDGDGAREEILTDFQDYINESGGDITRYFGVNEDVLATVELITVSLFKQWTNRRHTKADLSRVFFMTRVQTQNPITKEWTVTFPKDKRDLLMYAFEAAANAGRAGDWNYICGVLQRLHQRNITSLDKAIDYDFERDSKKGW